MSTAFAGLPRKIETPVSSGASEAHVTLLRRRAPSGDANPFNQAVIFAGLGDNERALEAIERSDAAGPFRVGRLQNWPSFAAIHG